MSLYHYFSGLIRSRLKQCYWSFSLVLILMLIYLCYTFLNISKFIPSLKFLDLPSTDLNMTLINVDNRLIILGWTTLWDKPFRDNLHNCKNKELANKCIVVSDRKLLNLSTALIFHVRDMSYKDLPPYKVNGSKFVFYTHESPQMTFIPLKGLPVGYFDWTMTYRLDSDVYAPYGFIEHSASPTGNPLKFKLNFKLITVKFLLYTKIFLTKNVFLN